MNSVLSRILLPLLLLPCALLTACGQPTSPPEETTDTTPAMPQEILLAEAGQASACRLVFYRGIDGPERSSILSIRDAISDTLGVRIDTAGDTDTPAGTEILIGAKERPEYAAVLNTLKEGEYAIESFSGETEGVVIAYKGDFARICAVETFINNYITNDRAAVPADLSIRGTESIITSSIDQLRDPCILYDNGIYYAYGTGWVAYMNRSGSLDSMWFPLGRVAEIPEEADTNYWAPEVYKYNGAYYMFTTYHSTKTGHRGCTIMKADSPVGPFVEITDGQITPHDWDAIDGTFYVDPDGQPWMIFVHEWTSTDDGIGRMAAAKLSEDLTHFISEPIELFRADDPSWGCSQVTDGCWMYRCADGQLLMLWSTSDAGGYCVGIARSESGKVEGPWTHDKERLYSRTITGTYDGGHGMLFTDKDGQMYLSIHSPNAPIGTRKSIPVFIPVKEENSTLVWDIP